MTKEKNVPSICDENVFEQLYVKHVKAVYNFIYYKSGDADMSEDLVQDAFLKLWNNCKKVEFNKAKAFLFTVAKNAFLNKVQKKKVALRFEMTQEEKVDKESPQYLLEEQESMVKLEKALSDLTEGQREVFLMNRIDGLKYREIAELLDISQKAVEKRMHQALLKLRKIYDRI